MKAIGADTTLEANLELADDEGWRKAEWQVAPYFATSPLTVLAGSKFTFVQPTPVPPM